MSRTGWPRAAAGATRWAAPAAAALCAGLLAGGVAGCASSAPDSAAGSTPVGSSADGASSGSPSNASSGSPSGAASGPTPSTWAGSCGPPVIGHRGEPAVAPEESIKSFRAALRDGAHILEGDIHFTSDGKPVLIHDDTVDRTTDGTGRVEAMSLRQIRRLDAGEGTTVPQLGELLDLARSRRGVDLILELKQPGASREQVQTFWSAVRARGMTGRVTVESFYPGNLELMRTVDPQARTALITRYPVSGEQARSQGPVIIPELGISTAERVRQWHKAGLKVYVWTADTTADWDAARDARVDGVLTNRTGAYEAWVAAGCR